ncbi:hypothetical protein D3C87_1312980 [compost metagenome]
MIESVSNSYLCTVEKSDPPPEVSSFLISPLNVNDLPFFLNLWVNKALKLNAFTVLSATSLVFSVITESNSAEN